MANLRTKGKAHSRNEEPQGIDLLAPHDLLRQFVSLCIDPQISFVGGRIERPRGGTVAAVHQTIAQFEPSDSTFNLLENGMVASPDWLPANIRNVSSWQFNVDKSVSALADFADRIAGEAGFFDDILGSVRDDPNGPSVDLPKELFANLAGSLTVANIVSSQGTSDYLLALSLRPGSAKPVQGMLKKMTSAHGTRPIGGVTLFTQEAANDGPSTSCCVYDDHLIVTAKPETLVRILENRNNQTEPRLTDSVLFQRLNAELHRRAPKIAESKHAATIALCDGSQWAYPIASTPPFFDVRTQLANDAAVAESAPGGILTGPQAIAIRNHEKGITIHGVEFRADAKNANGALSSTMGPQDRSPSQVARSYLDSLTTYYIDLRILEQNLRQRFGENHPELAVATRNMELVSSLLQNAVEAPAFEMIAQRQTQITYLDSLTAKYTDLLVQEAQLRQRFGAKHPNLNQVAKRKAVLFALIQEALPYGTVRRLSVKQAVIAGLMRTPRVDQFLASKEPTGDELNITLNDTLGERTARRELNRIAHEILTAYWERYFFEQNLIAAKSASEQAIATWKRHSGQPQAESQLREQCFFFRSRVSEATLDSHKASQRLASLIGIEASKPSDAIDEESQLAKLSTPQFQESLSMALLANNNFRQQLRTTSARISEANSHLEKAQNSQETLKSIRTIEKQTAALEAIRSEVRRRLTDAIAEFESSKMVASTNHDRLVASESEVDAMEAAFKSGTVTIERLLDAMRRDADAQIAFDQAFVECQLAHDDIKFVRGDLIDDFVNLVDPATDNSGTAK